MPPKQQKRRPGPIQISSPITRSPDGLLTPTREQAAQQLRYPAPASRSGSGSASPRTPTHGSAGGRGRNGRGGARGYAGYDEYDLSPTHAYLEAFDSYPSSPDPSHMPISPHPSSPAPIRSPTRSPFDSPSLNANEKDPLSSSADVSGRFGDNQFSSNHYLAPTLHPHGQRGRSAGFASGGSAVPPGKKYKSTRSCIPTNPTKRRWLFFGVPIALVVIAGIAIGVVVGIQKKPSSGSSSGSGSSTNGTSSGNGNGNTKGGTSNNNGVWNQYIQKASGGDGDTVTTDLGATFTYTNKFGGHFAQDPYNPYSVSGKAQSWSPSLLEEWVWGTHIARGVNLGGWLVTEPFICPSLYEPYQNSNPKAVDEYTLSQAMGKDLADKMEEHYRTFITEEDFALIASAGLNYVRIALGYWAVETIDGEPYLANVSWTYFLKAIDWARKYGIRIMVDFHALPGSQNGWNHSGKSGSVNWLYGVMGIANAQRSLETIRTITEFISQDGIKQVVPLFGLVNEVMAKTVGRDVMEKFYYQAYKTVRDVTGYGTGNGPILLMHEGFLGVAAWDGFLKGADRIGLDQHPYLAFGEVNTASHNDQAKVACSWGGGTNDSMTSFGIITGGEWSNAINDCGLWLNGVGSTPAFNSLGNCDTFDEWFNWSDDFKAGVKNYAMANMDALQNWFFWTWKIGNSTVKGYQTSPQWHYKLGWENGWMPTDPRAAGGFCKGIGIGGNQFAGTYPASATGSFASGATPSIDADQLASHTIWPPTTIGPSFSAAQVSLFPTLTQTGSRAVLPTQSHPANVTLGSGWANADDSVGAWVRVQGCDYPDAYDATAAAVPTALCTGSSKKRDIEHGFAIRGRGLPAPTAAPAL
ncbi:exo-beta-1,3-glucanase [Kwoniella heveanensis BCC8398]|uniref:glucan 1,3-beta-glucosidase n=1 Tax=Kwoniella heveanensis BCC8398 TaxID=1296120 RepID=A0A1B9GTH0_9TREE|nr:exo-beta-1,3-glucanase [Kwoniella heveanensis BCC8398]